MVTGTLATKDFVAAVLLDRRRSVTAFQVWMTLFVILGVALIWTGGRDMGKVLTVLGAIGWIAYVYWRYVNLPEEVEKRFKQMPELHHPVTYEWDADYFSGSNISTQSRRPWSYYLGLKSTDDMFLLYFADHNFQVIPKRWFATSNEADQFLQAAKVPRG